MNDDGHSSLVKSLKNEWSLFWESLAGEESDEIEIKDNKLKTLTLEDIREITRELSKDRKTLNQRLESLHKELDLNAAKLESLRLVGGEDQDTVVKINELNDQGQKISHELAKLDKVLRTAREQEDNIRRQLTPA